MKTLKRYTLPIILGIILIIFAFNIGWISNKIADLLEKNPQVAIPEKNNYAKEYDFEYVKFSKDFKPLSYQELLNVFFTVINNGWDNFTFYCPEEYTDCIEDIKKISKDDVLLTNINNYTHPFNNYVNIKTSYYENGEITLNIEHLYSEEEIIKINTYVDQIMQEILNESMSLEDKLKTVHDFIINHANYDQERSTTGSSPYKSNSAYGILFEKYGLCSGYADTYAIFLERLGVKNFKVASLTHVWNAVEINGEFLNVDLTWDDPVSNDGIDNLWHKYFLIPSSKFKELDKDTEYDHIYDHQIYPQVKE